MLASLVSGIHTAFTLWVLATPFFGSREMLRLHLIVIPFLVLHWITNSDTCALTIAEQMLRGVDKDDSIFHAIVSPVYILPDDGLKRAKWYAAILLWGVTAHKVL